MKLNRLLQVAAMSALVGLVTSCTTTGKKAGNDTDDKNTSVIATPSAKPVEYLGEKKTIQDLLAEIQTADAASNWKEKPLGEAEKGTSLVAQFQSKSTCDFLVFDTFQDAVNIDQGVWNNTYTLLGRYAQLGVIVVSYQDSCTDNLPDSIYFPRLNENPSATLLTATKANISDCLVRHAECLLDEGDRFPDEGENTLGKPLHELFLLSEAGFCVTPVLDDGFPGGRNSCDVPEDLPGSEKYLMITQVAMDADILRVAASTKSVDLDLGKYFIYDDGWAIYAWGSTEKQESLFLEMNKIAKGTLVALY